MPLTDGLGNLSYSKGFIETGFFFCLFVFTYKLGAKRMGLINRNLEGEPRAQGGTQIKSEINRGKSVELGGDLTDYHTVIMWGGRH